MFLAPSITNKFSESTIYFFRYALRYDVSAHAHFCMCTAHKKNVVRVSRHGKTCRQVQVISIGHSPAYTGHFILLPSGMRLMKLSVSVRNASDVFPHDIPGVATEFPSGTKV